MEFNFKCKKRNNLTLNNMYVYKLCTEPKSGKELSL